jgi:hypothetical protein
VRLDDEHGLYGGWRRTGSRISGGSDWALSLEKGPTSAVGPVWMEASPEDWRRSLSVAERSRGSKIANGTFRATVV